jgi:hypothetical protein
MHRLKTFGPNAPQKNFKIPSLATDNFWEPIRSDEMGVTERFVLGKDLEHVEL